MIDLAPLFFFNAAERAGAGDWDAVADYLQGGGEVTAELRLLLARRVRTGKAARGRPSRSYQEQIEVLKIVERVRTCQRIDALSFGRGRSLAAAKRFVLDRFEEQGRSLSEKTLEAYLNRHGGGLSDTELQMIEELRAEFIRARILEDRKRPRRSRN